VTSLILATATRFLVPLMLLFSVFLLLRGHDLPGGGFIGGLIAASAFALYWIAFDLQSARRLLRADPQVLAGTGLLFALASGLPSLLAGGPYLAAKWTVLEIPGDNPVELHVGTPLVFDVGVYLLVTGVLLQIVFTLAEERSE
jgi:multicomponent Na+:H+ antiporter subunit B